MSDIFNSIMHWAGLLGLAGTVGFIALMIFAPGVINVITTWLAALSPLVKGIGEGVVWFFQTIWEGFKDMTDNAASILFVVCAILVGGWWISSWGDKPKAADCKTCVDNLRKDYKFVPRQKKWDPFGLAEPLPLPEAPPPAPTPRKVPAPTQAPKKPSALKSPVVTSPPTEVWVWQWPWSHAITEGPRSPGYDSKQ